MPLRAVVRKDFTDAIRSFSLQFTTLLFVAFAAGLAAIQWIPETQYGGPAVDPSTLALLNSMRQPTVFMIPLIGLVLAYDALAGERTSGTLRLLIGLPNSRLEAVAGKFLGRTAVIAVAIAVGYAVAGGIALATYESFDARVFGLYTLLTIGYGAVYVGIATGFSAAMASRRDAFAGAGGLYALFILGWDVLLLVLQLAIYGEEIPEAGLPDWFKFLGMVNPSTAFMHAVRSVVPEYETLTFYPEGSAAYLQDWVGFVILAGWCVLPLAFGYLRFERADIH
ncbi:ABC transporter permease [Halobaculum sp. CBA1158]|uniref:ABC transporter permease n=1 Tax=Halobaculum sp. CBA1158 TaxID=2904243 RepID=UPI001F2C28CC|nr:ABC transporter permease [Halobaculum sp. CBA1158]UIO99692.1 ABC transporter permease [Halobaculum sp. CBA1158]